MGGVEGAATSMAAGAAAGVSPRTEPSSTPPGTAEELPPTRAGDTLPSGEGISPRLESSFGREGMVETPRASGLKEGTLSRTEGTPPLEPARPGDLPGTDPIRQEDASTARSGEVPPPPEEVPPDRTGEIPTAEEVPSGTPRKHHPGTCRESHHSNLRRQIGEEPKIERREAC